MKKRLKRELDEAGFACDDGRFDSHVENVKRGRALPQFSSLDAGSKFFDRILNIKKIQDFIFITKTAARNR